MNRTETQPAAKKPRPLISYQKAIYEIDPTVNAAGVEASMRLQYGTLSHLDDRTFRAEIRIAKDCEREEPGFLRMVAESYFSEDSPVGFDNAEHFVKPVDLRIPAGFQMPPVPRFA